MKKISLNTDLLPILNVDTYWSNTFVQDYDISLEETDALIQDIAPKYLKELIGSCLPSAEIYVTGVYHPSQYNYGGDELDFEVAIEDKAFDEFKQAVVNDELFDGFLQSTYKSSNGYINNMPENIKEFENAGDDYQLAQMLMFKIPADNIVASQEQYDAELYDAVTSKYSLTDDLIDEDENLEESKLTFPQGEDGLDTTELIQVYQMHAGDDNHGYIFQSLDFQDDNTLARDNYDNVANIHMDVPEGEDVNNTLDDVFAYGNSDDFHDKYTARSISISDILKYRDRYYFVDSFGFEDITDRLGDDWFKMTEDCTQAADVNGGKVSIFGEKEKKLNEDAYDEFIENEKGLAKDYKDRLIQNITPEIRNAFNDLKDILTNEDKDTEVNGFYFPNKAVEIVKTANGDGQYHLNANMDLNVSDILNMVDDNETIESAIDELFDDYKADSAFSWGDNFINILSKMDFDVHEDADREEIIREIKAVIDGLPYIDDDDAFNLKDNITDDIIDTIVDTVIEDNIDIYMPDFDEKVVDIITNYIENNLNESKKITESIDKPIVIKYWETEEDRDQGNSNEYGRYTIDETNNAIEEAKHLIKLNSYASIEVYNDDNDETIYWTDGVEEEYFKAELNKLDSEVNAPIGHYETYLIFEPVENYDEVITKVIFAIQDIVGPVKVQYDGKQALELKKNGFDEGFKVAIEYDTDANTIKDKIYNILENPENHIISNNTVRVIDESKKITEARVLKFQQVTDDRFDKNINELLQSRLDELTNKLDIDGVEFSYDEPHEVDFRDSKQWRADCTIKKITNDLTWNDIFKIVNSVKAVPYKFVVESKEVKTESLLGDTLEDMNKFIEKNNLDPEKYKAGIFKIRMKDVPPQEIAGIVTIYNDKEYGFRYLAGLDMWTVTLISAGADVSLRTYDTLGDAIDDLPNIDEAVAKESAEVDKMTNQFSNLKKLIDDVYNAKDVESLKAVITNIDGLSDKSKTDIIDRIENNLQGNYDANDFDDVQSMVVNKLQKSELFTESKNSINLKEDLADKQVKTEASKNIETKKLKVEDDGKYAGRNYNVKITLDGEHETFYTPWAESKEDAKNKALQMAKKDLSIESIRNHDNTYSVTVKFDMGDSYSYKDYDFIEADNEEQAKEEALRRAYLDLKVVFIYRESKEINTKNENKKLTEGPGAGYTILGSIDNAKIFTYEVSSEKEINSYGEKEININCDIDVELYDLNFSSYDYGGKIDFPVEAKVVGITMRTGEYDEELPDVDMQNIKESLDGITFKALLGAGWSHVKFTGLFNAETEGDVYAPFCIDNVTIEVSNKTIIEFIDNKVSGCLDKSTYEVQNKNGDLMSTFDDEDKAINYAKENNASLVVKVYHDYSLIDADGSEDDDPDYDIIWSVNGDEELEESKKVEEDDCVKTKKLNEAVEMCGICGRMVDLDTNAEDFIYCRHPDVPTQFSGCCLNCAYKHDIVDDDGEVLPQYILESKGNLSRDLFGKEADSRMSQRKKDFDKHLQWVKDIMAGKTVIDDKYNDEVDLETAKKWLKDDYVYLKGFASLSPEDINKKLAKDIPEVFSITESLDSTYCKQPINFEFNKYHGIIEPNGDVTYNIGTSKNNMGHKFHYDEIDDTPFPHTDDQIVKIYLKNNVLKNESFKEWGVKPENDLYEKMIGEIAKALDISQNEVQKEGDAIKFRYNDKVYFAEPVSQSQIDVFDDNHEQIGWGVIPEKLKGEVFTEYTDNDYIYELVGGEYAGEYTRAEAEKLPIKEPELTDDLSEVRANGGFVHRKELDNQLQFKGYLGPMWNGIHDDGPHIRYETQEVYDKMSESKTKTNISTIATDDIESADTFNELLDILDKSDMEDLTKLQKARSLVAHAFTHVSDAEEVDILDNIKGQVIEILTEAKSNDLDKVTRLKLMDRAARSINDEDIFELWLMAGVPDGATEEDFEDIAKDDKAFSEIEEEFKKVMKLALDDGLYDCDEEAYEFAKQYEPQLVNESKSCKTEAKFKDKVKAIKRSLKKNDKRLSDETAQASAERIAGSMIKNEGVQDDRLQSAINSLKSAGYTVYKEDDNYTALINDNGNEPILAMFYGKSAKPRFHYRFPNKEALDKYLDKYLSQQAEIDSWKADRKAARKLTTDHDIKVGDIFYTYWGYDQTNSEFYEVVNVRGSKIDLKEISYTADAEDASWGQIKISPAPGNYVSDEIHTVSARADGTVTNLDGKSFLSLSKYTGTPISVTAPGWGH